MSNNIPNNRTTQNQPDNKSRSTLLTEPQKEMAKIIGDQLAQIWIAKSTKHSDKSEVIEKSESP